MNPVEEAVIVARLEGVAGKLEQFNKEFVAMAADLTKAETLIGAVRDLLQNGEVQESIDRLNQYLLESFTESLRKSPLEYLDILKKETVD